jgi:hypothetical protein
VRSSNSHVQRVATRAKSPRKNVQKGMTKKRSYSQRAINNQDSSRRLIERKRDNRPEKAGKDPKKSSKSQKMPKTGMKLGRKIKFEVN